MKISIFCVVCVFLFVVTMTIGYSQCVNCEQNVAAPASYEAVYIPSTYRQVQSSHGGQVYSSTGGTSSLSGYSSFGGGNVYSRPIRPIQNWRQNRLLRVQNRIQARNSYGMCR